MSSALRPRLLAAAVSLCFIAPAAVAQVPQALSPVVITGARFDADPSLAPIGATVITADEIRRAGASDVNAAIRKIGGVFGRQSLDGSPDFTLDLRGFGTNSAQNMVIVVDGVRLSENELRNPVLSTIPIDSVERIEITRGGASVLYGDGATGGVINIVTKRPDQRAGSGSVFVEGGSFHAGEARASMAQSWSDFSADVSAGHQRTDNYRDNNAFRQSQLSGGLQWHTDAGRVGVRYEGARQDSRLPGALTEAQFKANPRQTFSPNDYGALDSDRLTGFGAYRLDGHDLAAELSYRKRTVDSNYLSSDFPYVSSFDTRQLQFSPRVRKLGAVRGMVNELLVGADFTKWERTVKVAGAPADPYAEQKSKAVYLRDELRFDPVHDGRISAGVRRELFDKHYRDTQSYATTGYNLTQGLNAWEIQLSYMPASGLTVFGKAGQSYRLANADENAYTPVINEALRPQKSKDLELGATYAIDAASKATARLFRSNLTDEIFYDPVNFANTNLDPTRRQGFELDAEQRIAPDWRVSAHYQYVDAKFRSGAFAGRQMVLVPEHTVTARLSWVPATGHSADLGVQWVDDQRYGEDFANSCAGRIPSYTTLDGRYARTVGQWELAVSGQNLTDKRYYSQAYSCLRGNGGIYTADGRQLKLSAR
ncbi:outer membrane hemin/siderophore receptor protein [Duganella sp. Leaf126]|uniref:TonB-dependent receptor family protein n=1 Tax=Duganella sp. Leaf126 TaxID=1736266 RepID=UPI0006FE7B55|nr:TonB-dependent receptor [Duganella sp. Leaf126]KQQ46382.1 outer membrane hemin/siderophore receptor protein [Duganella sp. Leaf126]